MLKIEIDRAIRLMAVAVLPVGIIAGTVPNYSVLAQNIEESQEKNENRRNNNRGNNDFDVCLRELLAVNIESREAGDACARALEPRELSSCVEEISDGTPVESRNALQKCFQVRRPLELSSCTVDIYQDETNFEVVEIEPIDDRPTETEPLETQPIENQPVETRLVEVDRDLLIAYANLTLDYCRRSLLPKRYSECVVAVNRELPELPLPEALQICISAEAYPESLFPPSTPGDPVPLPPVETDPSPDPEIVPIQGK